MFLDLLEAKQVNVSVTFFTPESGLWNNCDLDFQKKILVNVLIRFLKQMNDN